MLISLYKQVKRQTRHLGKAWGQHSFTLHKSDHVYGSAEDQPQLQETNKEKNAHQRA